jgi:TonB-linked SusC/RagA family outer membrane protein
MIKYLLQCKRLLPLAAALLLYISPPAVAQQRLITGNIKSGDDNQPFPGVNIIVKGSTNGTVSDTDGNFSIDVTSPENVLVFSAIGYRTVEVPAGNQSNINITLEADVTSLAEVVVIGYGTQKKADLTSAVATMKTDQLTERPLARVDQALVGQMAGVRVQQTSGMPGQGFKVQVRGTGSLTSNNEPLYVVDGFPLEQSMQNANGGFDSGSPLDNLNPNDIESIQVLKDAAAAAIYGSRASNGVVLITTRRGKTGKPVISFNTYAGFTKESKRVDFLNAEEWIDLATDVINYNYLRDHAAFGATTADNEATRLTIINQRRASLSQAPIAAGGTGYYNYALDDRWDPNHPEHNELMYIDWQDEVFRRGIVQNYNVSASGGNEHVNYFVSGDMLDQVAHIVSVDYNRYSARANVEVTASERVKFGINIAPTYSIANDGGAEGKDQQMHLTGTVIPVVERSIGVNANVFPNTFYPWGNTRVSPSRVLEESTGETKTFRTLSTAFINVNILKGLDFKTTLNLDHSEATIKNFVPSLVDRNRANNGRLRGNTRQTFVNENTLSFNRSMATVHNVSAVAGVSYSSNKFDNWDMRGIFAGSDVTTMNAGTINASQTYSFETRNVLISFFGRAQYSFKDRYLLSASLRRDGSSRFGSDVKWGTFPSVSAGWRVTEEPFFNIEQISDLKLRAAWGIAGNLGFSNTGTPGTPGFLGGDYAHQALLNVSNYSFGGTLISGQAPTNIPNNQLSWEQAETIDIGVDIGLLNNRIYVSADYYKKVNNDLLLSVPVPAITGVPPATGQVTGTAWMNIGEVENKGWEFEVTSQNIVRPFQWSTSLNLSYNKNKVLALGPDNSDILGGAEDIPHNILRVGHPAYSLYLVQQEGILTQADIDGGVARFGTQTAGDPKFTDQLTVDSDGDGIPDAGNGTIGPEDRIISGQPLPSHTWGISNTFKYKGFDLNILVQGQWGGHIYSLYGRGVDRMDMGYNENRLGSWVDRWRSAEDPGAGLKGKPYGFPSGRIKNTDWMYSSDYVRVRNITLGYDMGSLIKVKGISGLRLYMTLENYFGFDNYDGGWNPEAVNYNGDDYGAAPIPKSIIFGLNLKL